MKLSQIHHAQARRALAQSRPFLAWCREAAKNDTDKRRDTCYQAIDPTGG